MPKLGQLKDAKVRDSDDPDGEAGTVYYRAPTSSEWMEYQGAVAAVFQQPEAGRGLGQSMAKVYYEFGAKLIVKVEGFDVPDGEDARELFLKERPEFVADIGQNEYSRPGGSTLDLGKYAPPSRSSSGGGSAESPKPDAPTSETSLPPSGRLSAETPARLLGLVSSDPDSTPERSAS